MFKDFLEIFKGGIKQKSHNRSVVDADVAVEIAPVCDIQKYDVGFVVIALNAIEFACNGIFLGVQFSFSGITFGVGGYEGFRFAAIGTLFDKIDKIIPLFPAGGNKFAACVAETFV